MSVFLNPRASLLAYIGAANSMTVNDADVMLSAPKPTKGTWRESATTRNSFVKLTAKDTAPYRGSVVLTYNRLDLADFAKLKTKTPLPCYQLTRSKQLVKPILYYYGFVLTEDDVVDEDLNLTDGAGTYTLKAKDTSLGWIGQLPIDIVVGGAPIGDLATTKNLNGLNYPVSDTNATMALMYTYPMDFTGYRDQLLTLSQGATLTDAQVTQLVTALKALDTGAGAALWNADPASKTWSLAGAKVFFAGINSAALPTNAKYKYAVGLELRSDVTIPSGRFYLQFSDPVDPAAAE